MKKKEEETMTVQVYIKGSDEIIASVDIDEKGTKGIAKDGYAISVDGEEVK